MTTLQRIGIGLGALAAVGAVVWFWQGSAPPPPEPVHHILTPETLPEPATPTGEPPFVERKAADFVEGSPWSAGPLRGEVWQPQRRGTAWLVAASEAGGDPELWRPLVKSLWTHRDIAVVLLAADPTPVGQDRTAQRAAMHGKLQAVLAALPADGRPVVLAGAGRAGEAALQVSTDPRVLAVVALDPLGRRDGFDDRAWQAHAAKKWVLLAGPDDAGNAIDELSRGLAHVRTVIRGTERGAAWLTSWDQRAQVSGWLQPLLGQ
ncbi:MAG: hypothetical protein HY902_11375 [Deltaproteobacteria bacterium]|nr:hypothetical protein [Deltaproteobacteria bacterium]